jgi:hypothetical protein
LFVLLDITLKQSDQKLTLHHNRNRGARGGGGGYADSMKLCIIMILLIETGRRQFAPRPVSSA